MGRSGGKRNSFSSSSSATTVASSTASKRESSRHTTTSVPSSHSGCTNAFFHFFDFHRFRQFSLHHHSSSPPSEDSNTSQKLASLHLPAQNVIKDLAAPRNSLESEPEEEEEKKSSTVPLSSSGRRDENLNFPPMGIQIKTRPRNHDFPDDGFPSSEISVSPAIKTPTLVARLMGLDLLPDAGATHPPSSSSTPTSLHQHLQNLNPKKPLQIKHRNSVDGDLRGARSLPETPRISAARRSDADLHLHHRLSLQINKENMTPGEELILSRLSNNLKRKELKNDDENKSPGYYARQIAKQVKDSVTRKVGMDITNTVRSREELVNQFKAKKLNSNSNSNSKALARVPEEESSPMPPPSCSPRLRFLEPRNKLSPTPQKPPPLPEIQTVQETSQPQISNKKCKKNAGERQFSSPRPRPKKPVQEELFVRPSPEKKCKKTSLSSDLLNISVPTLLPVKKDSSNSPSVPKFSKKQAITEAQTSKQSSSQLSSGLNLTYKHQGTNPYPHPTRCNNIRSSIATSAAVIDGAEHEYIARILKRTGIDHNIPISFTRWFSPSQPLDPSIFYYLEHFSAASKNTTPLRHRCNRKLLFHLVDEILVEILKPIFNSRPWVCRNGGTNWMTGSELVEKLGSKIRSYPRADCQVLEDIDALIDRDLPDMELLTTAAFEEEGEGIAAEIEREILDELVRETAFEFRGVKTASFGGKIVLGSRGLFT